MTILRNLNKNAEFFLKKTLGQEGFEDLQKIELVKESTQTVVDHEEIKTALNIVPRTILSFLNNNLKELSKGDIKEFKIPVKEDAFLNVKKHDNDVYSGYIRVGGEIISKFKHRTLPGIGLIIMTSFELYDVDNLVIAKDAPADMVSEITKIIDERLAMRDMVSKVVDKKLDERSAIENLINIKLNQMLSQMIDESKKKDNQIDNENPMKKNKKPLKLKEFLERKRTKHLISLEKSETIRCPDCKSVILDNFVYRGCVCFGENMNSTISLKKTEFGISINFDSSWNKDNIEMLLQILRKRNKV